MDNRSGINFGAGGVADMEEGREIQALAHRHGLTMEEATGLIDQVGHDQRLLDQAAYSLQGRWGYFCMTNRQ